ncbi:restriction endonuclease subunit S [Staphylococcus saprophyticus]|uniref:restriction endonuclease subunit S n=1 Tax=Staphylococcus saprophyticus TaxID=29385 RepID=UPI0007B543B4|nr:restriction endonuclease subunit S [Staphylococcus saprophyticus]
MTNEVKNVPELRFPEFSEEWEEKILDEVSTFSKGKGISKNDLSKDGTSCILYGELYTTYDFIINKIKSKTLLDTKNLVKGKKNQVLIPSSGETPLDIATAAVINTTEDMLLGGDINVLTPVQKYDGKFISLSINGKNKSNLSKYAQGKSVVHLYNNDIKKLKIKFPVKNSEQRKIGDFFSKLDQQIELEEKKLAKLEKQKKGYMQKIFSQELRFKDENGNEYPEWEEKTIKDVYKVTRGYVLARKLMSDNPNSINKYPVYSSQTSNNGLMGYYSDYLYQDGITWTTDGANAGSVSFRQGKFYCTNVCGVLLNELGNSNVCMAEMLNNIAFKYVSKVGNPKLMNNVMAMIKLKFPCLEEQQAISKFLNVFSEVIDNQNKKVELLKERKKGLLQKMFV